MKIGSQDIVAVKLGDVDIDAVKVGDDFVFSSETVGGKWTWTKTGSTLTYVCDKDYQDAVGKQVFASSYTGYFVKRCWYTGTTSLCVLYAEDAEENGRWYFITVFNVSGTIIRGSLVFYADNTTSKGAKYLNFGDGYEARWSAN